MHSPPFFMHTKPQAGAARIGAWQAECAADIYDPIVRNLAAAALPAAIADAAALKALCDANIPTPANAGTANAFCDAQLSVTQNTGAKAMSKLGSSTWYNYQPVPVYTTVGGFLDTAFVPAPGPLPAGTNVYCIYWPSYAGVAGRTGGGTNKWAKNVINTVTTSSVATNVPAGVTGFLSLPTATTTPAVATAATALLLRPTFQETITVNYFKSYLPAGSL
jgi:hypothetical protein